ncbi:hypothetical protein EDC04DRAFT_2888588 [Pisolithus marmoratus]|nr:hypothetical protein EDC04DRAFT_2888588 [Pisolithus marmoratus]
MDWYAISADFLELSIRQQVLSDLVTLKHETTDALTSIQELIRSKTVLPSETYDSDVDGTARHQVTPRIFMSEARAHCHIAFGEHVANLSEVHIRCQKDALVTPLLDVLHDAPHIDYDRCLSWDEWALPDQLVYTTVSALLRVSFVNEDCAGPVINAILDFITEVIEKLRVSNSVEIFTQLTPSVHGLYRAITSTIYPWTTSQWHLLSRALDNLVEDSILERINHLLLEIHQEADVDINSDASLFLFCHTFISRYVSAGRPLSGYFIVCCVMEMQWTVLAQSLIPVSSKGIPYDGLRREAAAANRAWSTLMKQAAQKVLLQEETAEALRSTVKGALQCFNDLLGQMEDMDTEPPLDTYAWETMSESLKLASICCVAIGELDSDLYACLGLLLSDKSPIIDNLVQEAALKSTTVVIQRLVRTHVSFHHLRRFVTSPLSIFEFAFNSEKRAPPPLTAAAKCFALCIKLASGEDSIMSNMYSLLNFIAAISKEITETSSQQLLHNPLYGSPYASSADQLTYWSEETALRGRSDDEKRLIGITTISVVARLALEFDNEEVTKLTISMLLQRLRTVEPTLEAALVYNLADLALVAPADAFVEIVKAFSSINRVANSDDPRFSNNMVLAAQTRLARELDRRPDLYGIYLEELLTLFSDKGVAIQHAASSAHHVKTEEMIEQLASLLLPIEALLNHADFSPQANASPELTSLFRNMWLLCVLLNLTFAEDKEREKSAMTWLVPALGRIATKTPILVLESATDVLSDLEYNTNVRQEYARSVISKHRACLARYIPMRASETRSLSAGQVIFVLAMHDVETLRSDAGLPSSLVSYFTNPSLNKHAALNACMEALAEKVIQDCVSSLNIQAYSARTALLGHAEVANKYLNRLITSFPSLMCDPTLVYAILECLTLLRRACEGEFIDEYSPKHEFYSERTGITLQLTDDYKVRNDILNQLQINASNWFELALGRAPIELQSILQKYLAATHSLTGTDTAELGASVAEQFAKAFGPVHRQLTALHSLSHWKSDRSRVLTSQLASKGYFAGEAAGLRLACHEVPGVLDKNPPQRTSLTVIEALKRKMEETSVGIWNKNTSLMVQDLKRLLFRCAAILISLDECEYDLLHRLVTLPFEVFTPAAIATGIEVWTWVIAEKPSMEVALMSEVLSAWFGTVRERKGVFSQSLNYQDPFQHPISYVPTDKEEIDRAATNAQRLLIPHTLILQMLFSRLQSARYRRSSVMFLIQRLVMRSANAHRLFSTHPLARELRFSFLLFGFETLKSSHLDAYCEGLVRQSLYRTAYSWFAVQPQWTYGANRVQVTADIKILQEFLSHLQTDCVKGLNSLSSLTPGQSPSQLSYVAYLKNINHPLKLLVENEITRLTVWANPSNDSRRGTDHHSITERSMLENNWPTSVRTVWEMDPAIALYLTERFKSPSAYAEVERLVRTNPTAVASAPEGLRFLVDDKGSIHHKNNLQVANMHALPVHLTHQFSQCILAFAPVSPVIAVTFFEKKYNDNPYLLQYAHRVLKQHPVELTFFFVPQVVQALRFDDLGYIKQFILETAKLSSLFCHQIIWNMKANCYKDDAAEIEDPMKPALDEMIFTIVESLTGEARSFYDKEFSFFHEVTSISGKLKPFIKKTKPEKKAKIDEEMARIHVEVGVYLPSNPDGKVVDIDKHSGRPLQSHAKAPFMASFKVRKSRIVVDSDPEALLDDNQVEKHEDYEVWQQAIFKVGDDCRQDVLALQVIAMLKNIFTSIGLPLYFYPYRVTATAPGCGVIDVVPDSTSRDEMGRAKVNDLLDFFVSKYGGEETIAFQRARLNFIQSMAAYSVACYILQVKDRHNGNIMIDAEGHIIHIVVGCCSSFTVLNILIAYPRPGGVKFEPSSFKLNAEMVALMGGRYSQGYDLFQHLAVKGFLALRPHADPLVSTVQLMLGTGLPSFKGEATIRRLKDRFALGLNDRQAAEWMMGVIRNAHENIRSTFYDEFQRLQNGIPYK